jgi:hypothetical protein
MLYKENRFLVFYVGSKECLMQRLHLSIPETYQSQTICQSAVTFGIGVLYKTLWSKSEFHQNQLSKSYFTQYCKHISTRIFSV